MECKQRLIDQRSMRLAGGLTDCVYVYVAWIILDTCVWTGMVLVYDVF